MDTSLYNMISKVLPPMRAWEPFVPPKSRVEKVFRGRLARALPAVCFNDAHTHPRVVQLGTILVHRPCPECSSTAKRRQSGVRSSLVIANELAEFGGAL